MQRFSYAFGVTVGNNLKTVGVDAISYNAVARALEDVMKGDERIAVDDAQKQVQTTIQKIEEEKSKALRAAGEQFLVNNGERPEVTTTESGLQYEILAKGDGPIPTKEDKVKVHYSGMLIDGTVFDSSVDRGEPAVFGVTGVIKGWQEALQLMAVGSKWKVAIPYDLAYGEREVGGGLIPAFSVLVFDMELLAIEK